MDIPEDAIQAAANRLHARECGDGPCHGYVHPDGTTQHQADARAILADALPHLLRPIHHEISQQLTQHQRDYPDPDTLSVAVRNRAAGYHHALRFALDALDVLDAAARAHPDHPANR